MFSSSLVLFIMFAVIAAFILALVVKEGCAWVSVVKDIFSDSDDKSANRFNANHDLATAINKCRTFCSEYQERVVEEKQQEAARFMLDYLRKEMARCKDARMHCIAMPVEEMLVKLIVELEYPRVDLKPLMDSSKPWTQLEEDWVSCEKCDKKDRHCLSCKNQQYI